MKKSYLILFFAIMMIMASCSEMEKEKSSVPQFLDVNISISPEKLKPNQTVFFEAKVTYGEEIVKDADEVMFEIWRANDEKHEKVVVNHSEKGIYRLKKDFSKEGTYYVIAHVTARGMHYMPKKEFVVGTPSET